MTASSPYMSGMKRRRGCSGLPRLLPPSPVRKVAPAGSSGSGDSTVVPDPVVEQTRVRRDEPTRVPYTRGNIDRALSAGATEESKRVALETYRQRMYANTSQGPKGSQWNTWCMYHENWFKNGIATVQYVSVLPLTPDKIQAVASQMIHGGYRSVANYVSRAKDMHIAAEWPWTDSLAREARLANAAAKRGIGPAHQCQELPVEQAWRIAKSLEEMEGHSARHPKWPAGADRYVTVCSFYLLREIESTILRCRDVTFDHEQQTVSVALSVSKTDPQAIGCIRTWGCVCGKRNAPCPYHAAWVQHEYLYLQVAPLKVITDTLLKADASMVRAHQSRSRRSSERLHPMRRKPAIRRRTTLPSGQCVRGHQVCGRANAGKARASQPGRSGSPGVALVHQRLGAEDRKLATHACTDARAVVNNNWLGAVHRNVCAWALEPPGM